MKIFSDCQLNFSRVYENTIRALKFKITVELHIIWLNWNLEIIYNQHNIGFINITKFEADCINNNEFI